MQLVMLFRLLIAQAETTDRWPGFLGTGSSQIVEQSIPLEWSPTEKLAWTRPVVGYGQSSPVIWGDKVYVTTVDGPQKDSLHVICLNLEDGAVTWDFSARSTYPQKNSFYISRSAPTPVVDGDGIYAYFESGDVLAVSHAGTSRWTRSLSKEYGPPQNEFGLSSSPVQTNDRIVILIDDPGPSYLVALEKSTGQVLWKTDRTSRKSWTSPALVPIEKTSQIVVSSAGSVAGYDPQTGRSLWEFTGVGGNTGTTPTVVEDGTFLISAAAGRDGGNANDVKKSNGLMSVHRRADEWAPEFVWTNPTATPSWGSPIAHQGRAYWVNRVGAVYCLNVKSGELLFTERIKQGCWATPFAVGDRIYFFGKEGLTTVLASGNEFRVLAENKLWSPENPPTNNIPSIEDEPEDRRRAATMFSQPTVYGAAIVNGSIVLRTGSQVFCIRQ